MIEFKDVTKTYLMGANKYEALKGVSFNISKGELVAIIGPSGSGKTTTMNLIGLLDKPSTGEYVLGGEPTSHLTPNEQAKVRNRKIGFIFQQFFLLPRLNAVQNVGLPLYYARETNMNVVKKKCMSLLDKVGMAKYASHRPTELSGGQQQRVAIARALINEPEIILADEPTGALDSKTSHEVMELLIHQAEGTTVIIVTHDPEVAAQCERVIEVRDGLIERDGKPQ